MGASPSKHSSDEEAHIEWEHLETLHKGFSLGIKLQIEDKFVAFGR